MAPPTEDEHLPVKEDLLTGSAVWHHLSPRKGQRAGGMAGSPNGQDGPRHSLEPYARGRIAPTARATARLRGLYRLRAAQRRREGELRARRPGLAVGGGVLVALLAVSVFGVVLAIQAGAAAFASLTRDLPSLSRVNDHATFKTAQVFDRRGNLLWEFNDPDGGRRTVIPLSEMSQHLIDATMAAEDAYFYQHQGFDLRATVRSAVLTGSGEARTGASTITQQLVRNVLMDPQEAQQVTASRKLREIVLAYQLTQRLSKDQILAMYLNENYYGNVSYGVEAASESYFGKHARDLSLAEAALLAGLVQSPSYYDPTRRDVPRTPDGVPLATKERQAYVLEQMARHGFITDQQALDAYAEKLHFQYRDVELKAPHWVMYVRNLLERKYGRATLYQGGLKIYTTLDLDYDERMRQVLLNARASIETHGGNNAALVAVNPRTGEILAFNGSLDYNDAAIDGQVNVLLSERQPGSSIKPLVYSAAFLKGWTPGTQVADERSCWLDAPGRQWCPQNFDRIFHGPTTVRSALGNSLNIPAVRALEFAGVDYVVDLGRRLGMGTWGPDSSKHFGLSLTLGGAEVRPLDLTQVYATLANNGLHIPLVAITRVVDADGNALEDYKVPQGDQVIDPRSAYMITDVLADPAAKLFTYGPCTPLVLRQGGDCKATVWPSASKTGTTDNYRDTWTVGYTPDLVIGVWVGNSDGQPMREVLSSMTAGKIWPEAMQASFEYFQLQPQAFPRPDGLAGQQVCGDTAMRPGQPLCRTDLVPQERASRTPIYLPGAQPRPSPTPTAVPASGMQTAPTATPQLAPSRPSSRATETAAPGQPTSTSTAPRPTQAAAPPAPQPTPPATPVPPAAPRPPIPTPTQAAGSDG